MKNSEAKDTDVFSSSFSKQHRDRQSTGGRLWAWPGPNIPQASTDLFLVFREARLPKCRVDTKSFGVVLASFSVTSVSKRAVVGRPSKNKTTFQVHHAYPDCVVALLQRFVQKSGAPKARSNSRARATHVRSETMSEQGPLRSLNWDSWTDRRSWVCFLADECTSCNMYTSRAACQFGSRGVLGTSHCQAHLMT